MNIRIAKIEICTKIDLSKFLFLSARKIEKIDNISFMGGESKPKTDYVGWFFDKIVRAISEKPINQKFPLSPIYRNRKKAPVENNYASFFYSMHKPVKMKMKLEQPYFKDYVKKISFKEPSLRRLDLRYLLKK